MPSCGVCKEKPFHPDKKCCFNCARSNAYCGVWHTCGKDCVGWEPVKVITNGDHIRSLPDERLASFICSIMDCYEGNCPGKNLCHPGTNGLVEWMKQPYKEEKL